MTQFEQSVIGSILLSQGEALNEITLTPADFDDLANEKIYKTILEMKQAGQPIDVMTVGAALPKLASYLHDTVTATPTAAAVGFYANKVIEDATRRRLAIAGTMIHSKAQHDDLASVFDARKRSPYNPISLRRL
jgi:replicative DNA helicase